MPIQERMPRRTFLKRVGQAGGLLIAGGSLTALESACGNPPTNFNELLAQNEGKEMPLQGVSHFRRVNNDITPVLKRVAYYYYGTANIAYEHWEERDILVYEWEGIAPTLTGGTNEKIHLFEYVNENSLPTNQSEGKLDWLFQKKVITTALVNNPNKVLNLDGYSLATFLPTQTAEQASDVTGSDIYLVSNLSS